MGPLRSELDCKVQLACVRFNLESHAIREVSMGHAPGHAAILAESLYGAPNDTKKKTPVPKLCRNLAQAP